MHFSFHMLYISFIMISLHWWLILRLILAIKYIQVLVYFLARLPERSKGADLRSAMFACVGSNPTPCIGLIV